jgi:hypothetical protein
MGMPKPEIEFIYSETIEERNAKEQVGMLNNDIEIVDIDPTEDQKTYLVIYERAIETDAKKKAVEQREAVYREQLKQKQQAMVQ